LGKGFDPRLLECPECGSRNVLYRQKTKNFWCRKCGQVFLIDKNGRKRKIKRKH